MKFSERIFISVFFVVCISLLLLVAISCSRILSQLSDDTTFVYSAGKKAAGMLYTSIVFAGLAAISIPFTIIDRKRLKYFIYFILAVSISILISLPIVSGSMLLNAANAINSELPITNDATVLDNSNLKFISGSYRILGWLSILIGIIAFLLMLILLILLFKRSETIYENLYPKIE